MVLNLAVTPKQKKFMDSRADETLFGGAAGGGKSRGQLVDALLYGLRYPGSRQLMLRRTYPDLERSLVQEHLKFFPLKVYRYNSSTHRGMLKNGSVLEFGYCDKENDVYRYQGAEYDVVRFDELTHFTYNRYEQVYNDAWWYKIKHGTGCKMVVWDGSKAGGLGDIDIRMVDLLNLYWEPGITDLQASRNLFHVEMVDDEVLLGRWPWAQGHTGGAEQVPKYLYDDQVRTDGKSFVVDWYYKKAGRLHYCKFVNDCVLYASENDPDYAGRGYYDHGKYPFVMDVMFPMAGSPAGFGYIELMKGTQYSIDVLGAAITRNADAASRIRYFVNRGSGLNEEEFTDLDKSIIHVDGNLGEDAVRSVQVPVLSDIYVTHLNNKISELKETSGNRDFSQGVTGSGVTAASAIAALQEAGSKLSRDALKSAYRAFTEECNLCIELMRQFYTAPRAFRITGEGGTGYEFMDFDNSGLVPQREEMDFGWGVSEKLPVFDINVVAAKKSTYSRLSQNELAKELYQMGFFNPELADQSAACLQMMDFDGKEQVLEDVQKNGGLFQQVQQLQATMMKMAAVLDAQNGTGITANMGQAMPRCGWRARARLNCST